MSDKTEEILQRITSVETKLDIVLEDRKIASEALKTANEAHLSARSAHHRLNMQSKILFFAGTTIIGAVLVGIINYFMKGAS